MTELHTRVAIVGAGAAGLAAARRLRERKIDFLLLEARERIGGRAYTAETHDGASPVELGAEFVHGRPRSTLELLRECGETTVGTQADAFELHDGQLHEAQDRFETIERVLDRIDIDGADCSIEAFLERIAADELSERDRAAVRSMIEGFDAAIVTDASAIAIAKEWRSGVNSTASRPVAGYAPLMQHLARMVDDAALLRTPVDRIIWSREAITLHATRCGAPISVKARHAIVTVPAGVLRAQRDLFSPHLPDAVRAAIDAIAMGPVLRVVLDFRVPFWETLEDGRFRDGGFFATPDAPMRTLWTRAPQHTPLIVAWAGGGAAQRLIDAGVDPVEAAIETAARAFPSVDIRAALRNAYFHDWQRDPYACGAYSYLRVGAGDARARLATPIDGTIFFAGEATWDADAGTVGGALESGYRSAEFIPM